MLNKVRKPKEQARVGRAPENVQFKNKLTKSINNSSYETIRGIDIKNIIILIIKNLINNI